MQENQVNLHVNCELFTLKQVIFLLSLKEESLSSPQSGKKISTSGCEINFESFATPWSIVIDSHTYTQGEYNKYFVATLYVAHTHLLIPFTLWACGNTGANSIAVT